jgi:hypothetical protein
MPVITHVVKHIFSYPFFFTVLEKVGVREISIQRFISLIHNSPQSHHK